MNRSTTMKIHLAGLEPQPKTTLVDENDGTFTIAHPTSIAVGLDLAIHVGLY